MVVMQLVQGQGACGAKQSHRGSVLAGIVWVGWFCVEGTIMGYMGFEAAGGCNLATCEGGLVWEKSAKTGPQEFGSG